MRHLGNGNGKVFNFGYPEHAELLRATGVEVVEFDPLSDSLQDSMDAVLLARRDPE